MASNTNEPLPRKIKRGKKRKWLVICIAVLVVVGIAWLTISGNEEDSASYVTAVVKRGPLEITVLEGGSIAAQESKQIRSEVEGQTKILSIVEEGYLITEQDVEDGLVLVELDSKDRRDKLIDRQLQFEQARATLTESREEYEIQVNQNESDIKAAELDAKFARMDLEKYLGEEVAEQIIEKLAELKKNSEENKSVSIDFTSYAHPDRLEDGEAGQKISKLEDDLVMAKIQVGLAQTKLEGTKRLFAKDFVTKNELERDELEVRSKEINYESADTSKALFIKYEFPKQAEKLLSDYEEALRKLTRVERQAVSKLAQSEAKRNSAEARYNTQEDQLREIEEQIEKCIIRAENPGLVVYGDGSDRRYRDEQIEEGSPVRERQVLITIPNTTTMTVDVNVHESFVKLIKKGQVARIRVDAYPDKQLTGTVSKIGVLPNSQNRWINPDLKVYSTTIVVNGGYEWLKPGMSAEAEIIVEQLEDVMIVPIPAVYTQGDERFCRVLGTLGKIEERKIETGMMSESFVEVKSGLKVGESVLLRTTMKRPEISGDAGKKEGKREGREKNKKEQTGQKGTPS